MPGPLPGPRRSSMTGLFRLIALVVACGFATPAPFASAAAPPTNSSAPKTATLTTAVTAEAVVKALEASVSGGPGVQAYVKWQLLSAVVGKFPDDLVKRAIAVY